MEANENTGCVCEHTLVTNTQTVGDSTVYTYTCDMCGEDNIAPARTISNTVAYYWNPAQVRMWDNNKKPAAGDVFHNPIAKDGEAYVNLKPQEGGAQAASYVVNGVTTSLGKYLAIKYRYKAIDGISDATLYVNVQIAGQDNQKAIANAITDGWVVAVVDISGFNGYAGNESSASLTIFMTQRMELDVAYVVMSDDMADIRALLGEKETYFDHGNSFANVGTECDKNGACVSAHSLVTNSRTEGDSTVYTYTCSICGQEAAESRTVPNDLAYYWDPQSVYVWDNNRPVGEQSTNALPIGENGVAYTGYIPGGKQAFAAYPLNGVAVNLGKYLVLKYRYSAVVEGENPQLNLFVHLGGNTKEFYKGSAVTDGWEIAVIDISGFTGYDAENQVTTKLEFMCPKGALDLAYIAMADDMADVQSLLADGETYFDYGDNFASQGVEYNKDGSNVVVINE